MGFKSKNKFIEEAGLIFLIWSFMAGIGGGIIGGFITWGLLIIITIIKELIK